MGQAFLYNSIFFTYALVLSTFFTVLDDDTPWYLIPIAIGNFLGPVLLGRFFDSVGRRPMIAGTYGPSGVLLLGTAALFQRGPAVAGDPHRLLDGGVLLRLGRGEQPRT